MVDEVDVVDVDVNVNYDVDVVCLGESMVTFLPSRPGRLADVPSFERGIGGAESNVACALAAAGHRARWVSRVGADGFGDHLVETVAAYGVDTSAVQRDPHRPTGIYFRTAIDRDADGFEVVYYRTGSAASAMSPRNMPLDRLTSGRVLHLSGITAALSADCLSLVRSLVAPRRPGRPLISFDVNYRANLWPENADAHLLLDLARAADLVFVGEDEAQTAWGLRGPAEIRAALPEPDVLVVKQGATGATVYGGDSESGGNGGSGESGGNGGSGESGGNGGSGESGEYGGNGAGSGAPTTVPGLRVDVVAPVGAGDAFAAGFLSATLRGLPVRDRIRHGHLMAAAALTVPGDLGTPPARAHADRLAALDETAWGRLRLGPGWTGAADQEVRTP
nr:sugar kinase [Streptomyces sp. ISL-98]